jgi:hypothetical protein
MGVIHMNGRIYDPLIGRMMSADPFIQAPSMLQSYNRSSYVMNNPLNLTDPTGYFSWRNILDPLNIAPTVRAIHTAATNPNTTNIFNAHRSVPGVTALDNFVVRNPWAFQLGRIAAGVWGGPWAAAGATGYYTYLTTGCESCSVKAFGLSLGTAYAFQAAGDVGQGAGEYGAAHYVAHAAVGCASSVAGGGQCGAGALSAVAGLAGTQIGAGISITGGRFATAVIAGGVGSRLAGGSFIDGAQTAAYGYLFNYCAHAASCWSEAQELIGKLVSPVTSFSSQGALQVGVSAGIGLGQSSSILEARDSAGGRACLIEHCLLIGPFAGAATEGGGQASFGKVSNSGWSVSVFGKATLPVGGGNISGGYGSDGLFVQGGGGFGTIGGAGLKICRSQIDKTICN